MSEPAAAVVGSAMPTATIVLLTWKDRVWVDAALDGALAQTVPCQLLVSNDASGDGTFERLRERLADYRGPHRVTLLEQPRNLGVVGHCNAVLPLAEGDIVVMMAGDDVSRPDRVQLLLDAYARHPRTMAIGSGFEPVDADGRPVRIDFHNFADHFGLRELARARGFSTLLGAALSFRREVFQRFGPLRGSVEDNALTLRAALLGDCRNLPEPLVLYRQHKGSVSDGIFARSTEDARARKRQRDRRSAIFLAGTAQDFAACLAQMPDLAAASLRQAGILQHRYSAMAAMRLALADGGFKERVQALRHAWSRPGVRVKALEYATKLWRRY